MSEPYIRRKSGELLSSAVWNRMQVLAREDVARVQARVDAAKAALDARPGVEEATSEALRKGGVTVVETVGAGGQVSLPPGPGYWAYDDDWDGRILGTSSVAPILKFSTQRTSQVALCAVVRCPSLQGSGVRLQFLLRSGTGAYGPVSVPRFPLWGPGLATSQYTRPVLSSPEDWSAWLEYHWKRPGRGGGWPACGTSVSDPSGTANDRYAVHSEVIQLPVGDWSVQIALAVDGPPNSSIAYFERLSATVVG